MKKIDERLLETLYDGIQYGLKVRKKITNRYDQTGEISQKEIWSWINEKYMTQYNPDNGPYDQYYPDKVEDIKPYLRSMESMTAEERSELMKLFDISKIPSEGLELRLFGVDAFVKSTTKMCTEISRWLKKKHFNYLGVPKHLFIEVTPQNNPYKETQ